MARLAIAREFLDEYARLDKAVRKKVLAVLGKFDEPGRAGLNLEKVAGCKDDRIRTIRIDDGLRGVVLAPDSGDMYCLLAVLGHDDAYRFATNRVFSVNAALGILEVRDEGELEQLEPRFRVAAEAESRRLFAGVSDSDLARLGIDAAVLRLARLLTSEADLEALEHLVPEAQFAALLAVACGATVDEAWAEVAGYCSPEPAPVTSDPGNVVAAMERTAGQIGFVGSRGELAEVLADPGEAWRIFLRPGQRAALASQGAPAGEVAEFRDRDRDYLDWVAAHPLGYVLNIGRGGRGAAMLHRASCRTITSRAPFTGPYMKICSPSIDGLDHWALRRTGSAGSRCGTCHPSPGEPRAVPALAAEAGRSLAPSVAAAEGSSVPGWRAAGPRPGAGEVWLWARWYIPFERLSQDQRDARADLGQRIRLLEARAGQILDAS